MTANRAMFSFLSGLIGDELEKEDMLGGGWKLGVGLRSRWGCFGCMEGTLPVPTYPCYMPNYLEPLVSRD